MWGLVSHHKGFGLFSGKGETQCQFLDREGAGSDLAATLDYSSSTLSLDSGVGDGEPRVTLTDIRAIAVSDGHVRQLSPGGGIVGVRCWACAGGKGRNVP